jgi:hypothetical protein
MRYCSLLIATYTFLAILGCKKGETPANEEKDELSFVYNGTKYNYSVTNNVVNAGIGKGMDGTPNLMIDMPNAFPGRVYFEKTGCAYLEPEFASVRLAQGCQLKQVDQAGNLVPIDSSKVFIYQSGSLNVSFSDCSSKSGVDFVTGYNYQYNECAAIGTFGLTLANKNNELIKITDGVVKFHHVIVY